MKALQGKIYNVGDGLAAFGIGALAGGVGASLIAYGLAGASVVGGALAGFSGALEAGPIQGIGNKLYFGDPYAVKSFVTYIGMGAFGGAVFGGAAGFAKGKNIWLGKDIANGRSAFIFNNTAQYTAGNTNYGVNAEGLQRVINPETISETLEYKLRRIIRFTNLRLMNI